MADSQVLGGIACDFDDCTLCDLLPSRCTKCDLKYCDGHYRVHNCLKSDQVGDNSESLSPGVVQAHSYVRCAQLNCQSPALVPFSVDQNVMPPCDRCQAHYCIAHRDYFAHGCVNAAEMGTESAGAKNKNARALLLKNFAVTTPRPSKAGKPVIRKQSKTIQMMKLRQAAKPGEAGLGIESVPQQERIYVQARAEDEFRPFWFRKTISTGRAFDLLQAHLGLASYKQWELFKENEDDSRTQILRFDLNLSETCPDDGCKLLLIQKPST